MVLKVMEKKFIIYNIASENVEAVLLDNHSRKRSFCGIARMK